MLLMLLLEKWFTHMMDIQQGYVEKIIGVVYLQGRMS